MSAEKVQNAAADDDEEVPTLEAAEVPNVAKQPKRYAKAMSKMGLKPEANISKIHIRKFDALSFAVAQPEVYRFPNTNVFIIFGEAQLEDAAAQAQVAAARAVAGGVSSAAGGAAEPSAKAAAKVEEVDDDAEVDAGDLQEKEINVVMSQGNVSRARAIEALKNNDGDIVNAIMELTM